MPEQRAGNKKFGKMGGEGEVGKGLPKAADYIFFEKGFDFQKANKYLLCTQ